MLHERDAMTMTLSGFSGLSNNLPAMTQQMTMRSGLIKPEPNLTAHRAPNCAPAIAPPAIANATGSIMAPFIANIKRAPMLLEAFTNLVLDMARKMPRPISSTNRA